MAEKEFNIMLLKLSTAIPKKDVHMLKVLYEDLANVKADLQKAECAFDLFEILRIRNILNPTDISVLFETIELTGLTYLKEIIEKYQPFPDEVKITRFSAYRRHVVSLGKGFSVEDLRKLSHRYRIDFSPNPWELIQHLENNHFLHQQYMPSFLQSLTEIGIMEGIGEASTSEIPELDKDSGEESTSKRPDLDKGTREASTSNRPKLHEVDRRAISRKEDETYTSYYNRLKENIRQSNMHIRKNVRGDGNCFLYCIQDQLERFGLPNRSSAQLRADLVDYLRRLDEKDPLIALVNDKYLDEFSKDGTYVDEIAVRGMSRILNHDFHIVTSQRISTEQGYLVTKIHESSNPDGAMLFGQIGELHYISLGIGQGSSLKRQMLNQGYGGPADSLGESTMSSHLQQPPPARLSLLPQQLQQLQAQILAYNYLAFNQPIPDSLLLAVHGNCPMQSLQRPSSDIIIKDSLTTRQKEKYKNENRMTPAIWHKHHKVNIADVFTELKLLQSKKEDKESQDKSTCIVKDGRLTSLTEALGVIQSTESCKVVITGKGGMGKTTLLKYIAHQWATDDEHIFADKLLFLINIRELKASEKFLDIIMKKIDCKEIILKNKLQCDSVESFLVTHDDEIVILLDGYDELERDAKDPIDLFKRSELRESTVVITSRPDNTADLIECCDVHIEVKGFSPRNIKKYIHNHFHSIGEIKIGDSLIKEFRLDSKYTFYWGIGDHKEAFGLCSSPLLLLQICTIWKLKHALPTDLSDLFKELICCILNQYLNRTGNKTAISNFDRIPDQYKSAILVLGECMYEGLKENKLSIDKYVLSKMAKNENLVNFALKIGFVYEDNPADPGDVREMYTSPHKLMSEALAGLYLSTQIQIDSLKVDEYEVIRSNDYLNMTREFTIGFLGSKADKLLKHWLIIKASNLYSIAQCFIYTKEENEEPVLQELDKDMSTEMKSHCEQMCETLRSVLKDDKSKSEHLFKLMKRCCIKYEKRPNTLEKKVLSLVNISSEVSFRTACRSLAHILVILEGLRDKKHEILRYISNWKDEILNVLSAEMKFLQLNYNHTHVTLHYRFNSSFLIHLLTHSNNLSDLTVAKGMLTEAILSVVTNQLHKTHETLKLTNLNISGTDLHNINGTLLGKLFEIAPKLNYLNVGGCRLSGDIVRAMITGCQNSGVKLGGCSLDISNNDIDDALLGDILNAYPNISSLNIASCGLSEKSFNIKVNEFPKIQLCELHFRQNYLGNVDGEMFGTLLKNLPKLLYLGMRRCGLSGSVINVMMEECCRMNIVLKDNMLRVCGNDLSDIDGKSLAELVRVIDLPCGNTFTWSDYSLTADNLEKLVESVGVNKSLNWKWINLSNINLSSISGRTLAYLFKISPDLIHINMAHCSLSGNIINEMMEECGRMNVVLEDNMLRLQYNDLSDIDSKSLADLFEVVIHPYSNFLIGTGNGDILTWSNYSLTADNLEKLVESVENIKLNCKLIDLSNINLSSISGRTLGFLFKICPDLFHIDMSDCSLSGSIVNEMIEECGRMNVVLKDNILSLKSNDLSDIDGKSLAELVRVIHQPYDDIDDKNETFRWNDYSLTADNLEKLVESVGVNMTLNWKKINLSGINLSSISGRTLACLFKISPDLIHIGMSDCSLSGSIVNEMIEECGRMNVVLKDNMLELEGSDLSGIDGKSLAELFRVMRHSQYDTFTLSDYSLTADNLKMLIESVDQNTALNWKRINLSMINLSSISGRTLACLFKIFPDLIHIDMSRCSLSGSIVNDMMEECGRMNVVLKDNMLRLGGNDLSDIDGNLLAELVMVIALPFGSMCTFKWSDYSLTADYLEKLIESVDENMTFNWHKINLSGINLSSISGRTLACLFKVSPYLIHIDMRHCRLSVIIVNEMIEECGRMNVVLKDSMLSLEGNDLSGIDGKSLVELVRVIAQPYDDNYKTFKWSDYSLTADNLQQLVESVGVNTTLLKWERLDLSNINLSSLSGKTLAFLIKISPDLIHIDMSYCSLSGSINEMTEECSRMNVVLQDNMLYLKGNDLSDIQFQSYSG